MTTTTGILLFDDAEELDFAGPWEVLAAAAMLERVEAEKASRVARGESEPAATAGALAASRDPATWASRVVTIAESARPQRCAKGMRVVPDHRFADAPALDVIVVPGGMGTRREVGNPALIEWLRKAGAQCRWVTSVCTGALLLHEAGFARGKRVTTHWSFVEQLRQRGDVTVLENVRYVRDGNVVTAAGVSAGIDMALWLVGQLHDPAYARRVQHYIEYHPAPPYPAEV
jgi:transcriptional regulator GlxA family with amidase domain